MGKNIKLNNKVANAIKEQDRLSCSEDDFRLLNSIQSLVQQITGSGVESNQVSKVDTLRKNNRYYLVSNDRTLLNELYVEHGVVENAIEVPVKDAFRKGFNLTTKEMSEDEIDDLKNTAIEMGLIEELSQGFIWNRLFGGAGILIITDQDPETPLQELKQGDRLAFRAVDMWELFWSHTNIEKDQQDNLEITPYAINLNDPNFTFNYYVRKVHHSRVIVLKNKEAPSFIRPRLRGWGISEIEKLVNSLNQFFKNNELIFELLDEAKVDVYKIDKLNGNMLTANGMNKVLTQIQTSNRLKSNQSAIVLDKNDDYEQKQISFGGLSEILKELRISLACDFKMPMTKLWGISASGFNSGEDDIETYNGMVESEIRVKAKPAFIKCLKLISQVRHGYEPDYLHLEFEALRILSSEQEENVKTQQANRLSVLFDKGLISVKEAKESINKANLLPIKITADEEIYKTTQQDFTEDTKATNSLTDSIKKIQGKVKNIFK